MSYYFVIIGTEDNPLFEHEFGTSKQGGDGQPRFSDEARHMNQFIVHSSLDIVEEVQWGSSNMYLKCIDRFFNSYISCFITPSNTKFLLLHQPLATASAAASSASGRSGSISAGSGASSALATGIAMNPTSPQTEEAVRSFFVEVYENWVKAAMSPFYRVNAPVTSSVFRQRVAAAGRKYL